LDNENWKWVYAIDSFIDTKTLLWQEKKVLKM
jgi:hypothetical protein